MLIRAFILRSILKMVRILSGHLNTTLGRHLEPVKIYKLSEVATFVDNGAVGLAQVGVLDSTGLVVRSLLRRQLLFSLIH